MLLLDQHSISERLHKRKLCLISLSGTPKASYGATEPSAEEMGLPVNANGVPPNDHYAKKNIIDAATSLFYFSNPTLKVLQEACLRHEHQGPKGRKDSPQSHRLPVQDVVPMQMSNLLKNL